MVAGQIERPTGWTSAAWVDTLKHTYREIIDDRVLAVAAGVTYYGLLAIFPAITVFVSFYGLFADRSTVVSHLQSLQDILPGGALAVVSEQMQRIADGDNTGLGLAVIVSSLFSIWSSNAGTKAMMEALNIAHDVKETRSFLILNFTSLIFTLGTIATIVVLIGAVAVIPLLLKWFFLDETVDWLLRAGRWPLVFFILLSALATLYRFGSDRRHAEWRWITPGSLAASAGLLVFSMLFSWYAANLGSYNETYGSLGAVIAFLTWMWLCTVIVIIGAELNAEIENSRNDYQRATTTMENNRAAPKPP